MAAKLFLKFKGPLEHKIDRFCQRFPLFSSMCIQLAATISMTRVMGSVAMTEGSITWLFYKLFGAMQWQELKQERNGDWNGD